jgi:hypothetical protein
MTRTTFTITERIRLRSAREIVPAAAALTCLFLAGFFALWRGPMPFEALLAAIGRTNRWEPARVLASAPASLRKYYALSLAVALGLAGLTIVAAYVWARLGRKAQQSVWQATATLACSCAICLFYVKMQYEGQWAPVDRLMTAPGTSVPYGHRLLFVWLANAFRWGIPALSPLACYYASQMVATLLAVYAVGRWSALHVGESLSWLGQALAVILISTCFSYRDFYDIGIVFFFTCGLLAIYRRKYAWFVLLVAAGTLNHENALLLIPTAAFLIYDKEPRRVWLAVIAASLAGHVLVRVALQAAIPFAWVPPSGIWTNMVKLFVIPQMRDPVLALVGWYALGLLGLSGCDPRLRRLVLLFPQVFAVTFLFGQFHEPRQFAAFVPVLVAILLSNTRRSLGLELRAARAVACQCDRSNLPEVPVLAAAGEG